MKYMTQKAQGTRGKWKRTKIPHQKCHGVRFYVSIFVGNASRVWGFFINMFYREGSPHSREEMGSSETSPLAAQRSC